MIPVSRRGGFSDRNGINPLNTEIQLKDFDEHTRVMFINSITTLYEHIYKKDQFEKENQKFFRYVLKEIYAQPLRVSGIYTQDEIFKIINETFSDDNYDAILTTIEAIIQYFDQYLMNNMRLNYWDYRLGTVYDYFNAIFQQEYVGYRFIGKYISPISDDEEVTAITESLRNPFTPVREHIEKANILLSDRDNPDYENSIKESISAVEAICTIIVGKDDATLGKSLKIIEDKGIIIHPVLKIAFDKLYGYTSDADGIRHASGIGGSTSTFEEAKFMLVSCSAFINYLMGIKSKFNK